VAVDLGLWTIEPETLETKECDPCERSGMYLEHDWGLGAEGRRHHCPTGGGSVKTARPEGSLKSASAVSQGAGGSARCGMMSSHSSEGGGPSAWSGDKKSGLATICLSTIFIIA
jgi:hypothetical protein